MMNRQLIKEHHDASNFMQIRPMVHHHIGFHCGTKDIEDAWKIAII